MMDNRYFSRREERGAASDADNPRILAGQACSTNPAATQRRQRQRGANGRQKRRPEFTKAAPLIFLSVFMMNIAHTAQQVDEASQERGSGQVGTKPAGLTGDPVKEFFTTLKVRPTRVDGSLFGYGNCGSDELVEGACQVAGVSCCMVMQANTTCAGSGTAGRSPQSMSCMAQQLLQLPDAGASEGEEVLVARLPDMWKVPAEAFQTAREQGASYPGVSLLFPCSSLPGAGLGTVVGFQMRGEGVTGTMDGRSLGKLKHLVWLDFSDNPGLTGVLSASDVAAAPHLQYVDIRNTSVTLCASKTPKDGCFKLGQKKHLVGPDAAIACPELELWEPLQDGGTPHARLTVLSDPAAFDYHGCRCVGTAFTEYWVRYTEQGSEHIRLMCSYRFGTSGTYLRGWRTSVTGLTAWMDLVVALIIVILIFVVFMMCMRLRRRKMKGSLSLTTIVKIKRNFKPGCLPAEYDLGQGKQVTVVWLWARHHDVVMQMLGPDIAKAVSKVLHSTIHTLKTKHCGYAVHHGGRTRQKLQWEHMLVFHAPEDAVRFSLDIQKGLMEAKWPMELGLVHETSLRFCTVSGRALMQGLPVSIGIHTSEPEYIMYHQSSGRVFYHGPGISLATRVAKLAAPGQMLLTFKTYSQLVKASAEANDCGQRTEGLSSDSRHPILPRWRSTTRQPKTQVNMEDTMQELGLSDSQPNSPMPALSADGCAGGFYACLRRLLFCMASPSPVAAAELLTAATDGQRQSLDGMLSEQAVELVQPPSPSSRSSRSFRTVGKMHNAPRKARRTSLPLSTGAPSFVNQSCEEASGSVLMLSAIIQGAGRDYFVLDMGLHEVYTQPFQRKGDGAATDAADREQAAGGGNSSASTTNIHLMQVVRTEMAARILGFDPVLKSKIQKEPSFFMAPGVMETLSTPDSTMPYVTMVFCGAEGFSKLRSTNSRLAEIALAQFADCIRLCLRACSGYECQERDGTFMISFNSERQAVEWAIVTQEALPYVAWQEVLDVLPQTQTVFDTDGETVLFRGLRPKIGIFSAQPTSIVPHRSTGRADYFGTFVNRSARMMVASQGGQILMISSTAEKVASEWEELCKNSSHSTPPTCREPVLVHSHQSSPRGSLHLQPQSSSMSASDLDYQKLQQAPAGSSVSSKQSQSLAGMLPSTSRLDSRTVSSWKEQKLSVTDELLTSNMSADGSQRDTRMLLLPPRLDGTSAGTSGQTIKFDPNKWKKLVNAAQLAIQDDLEVVYTWSTVHIEDMGTYQFKGITQLYEISQVITADLSGRKAHYQDQLPPGKAQRLAPGKGLRQTCQVRLPCFGIAAAGIIASHEPEQEESSSARHTLCSRLAWSLAKPEHVILL